MLDTFWPRGAPWSGQVISSPPGPSGGPSKTHLLPGGGVPPVHRARSPVPPRLPHFATLRSVHQFAAVAAGAYPPRRPPNALSPGALAPPGPCYWLVASGTPLSWRRLPSLGVGVWRCAPLLPWRLQCPVSVCAVLAAGSGGSGRYLVLCLSRFPLPAARAPRCVLRVVPSGCPLPSLAGTPFHAVCAFRELGPVALLVVPACPLRVCALALPQRPPPPPWVVWRAHLVRSRHWVPHRVSCPGPLLHLACLGGGGPVPVPPYLAWGCCCEGRLRSGAPPVPTARPLGGVLGSATHVLWARLCGCGGPTLSPWPACPVEPACRGGGVGGGPRGGGGVACHCCEVRLVSGAVPPPTARPLGRANGVPRPVCSGCGRCGRGDPALVPQRAPLRAGVARCGAGGRASPGGGAFHHCEGCLRSGAPPPPTARPLGGLFGSATHVLWAQVCGCGGSTLSHWPACPVGAACRGGGGRPSPGGLACHRCEGRLVSAAVPPPAARPLERAAGVPRPVCPGCGRCGRWDPAPAPQRAPLRAGVARCGGGGRASPGGVPSTIVRGV